MSKLREKVRSPRHLMLFVALTVAAAAVCTEAFLYQKNTLLNNSSWTSTKVGLARNVVGAVAFITTRTALSENSLNLGSWHGLNEVTFNDHRLHAESIEFRFRVDGKGYLIFEYDRTPEGFAGIRISRSEHQGGLLFRATSDGAFIEKQELPALELLRAWNTLRVEFGAKSVHFFLNGKSVAESSSPPRSEQWIGFRSSTDPTWVKDIQINQRDGLPILRESFRNTKNYAAVFMVVLLVLLIVGLLPAALSKDSTAIFGAILIQFFVLLFVSSFYLVDFYRISKSYPSSASQIDRWLRSAGAQSFVSNIEGDDAIVKRISDRKDTNAHVYRVLLVGSSQTWGAGVSKIEDGMGNRLELLLNADPALTRSYGHFEVLDMAVSGARLKDQWALFNQRLGFVRPNLVMINMSNNDSNGPDFETNLKRFAHFDRENKIRTVFVLEPNYIEADHANVATNHKIMRKVANLYDVSTVDLQAFMNKHVNDGISWWDEVHMTSFGQKLAAQRLYDGIRTELQGGAKTH